jgi:hypothetical protein
VARVQQLELEVQRKSEIISDLRDAEATLRHNLSAQPIVIRPADLVCQSDIATRTGWTRHRVNYLTRNDYRFPLPLTRLGDNEGIPVWDYREVQVYIDKYEQRRAA